ncbi:ankyrin repeat-containing domain protein [Aspergillus unguis]
MASTININAQNMKGCMALWNATCQRHDQVASCLLIENDMQVNSTGTGESMDQSTSLHHAVEEGNLALVHQLLNKSTADPNVSDEDGRTPLWWAAYDGDQLLVRSLLDNPRTERHRRDNSGRAAVDAAKSCNEDNIVCLLTNCHYHCPTETFVEGVLIVILIPILLLLSLASVVKRALA